MGICYFFLCKGSTKKYWVQDKRCDLRDLIPPPSFHPTLQTSPAISLHENYPSFKLACSGALPFFGSCDNFYVLGIQALIIGNTFSLTTSFKDSFIFGSAQVVYACTPSSALPVHNNQRQGKVIRYTM